MWGAVLLLALVATADPMRIGVAVLLMSRPRPMLNLLVFWIAGMATGLAAGLIVVFVLGEHVLSVVDTMSAASGGAGAGAVQIVAGALAMALAARFVVRQRHHARIPVGVGADLPASPAAFAGLPPVLSERVRGALEGRSLSPALLAGLGMATPLEYIAALVVIVASGAAAAPQTAAVVVYMLFAFAIAEIPLLSQMVAPARTHATMMRVHDWVQLRRRLVLAVVIGVVGAALVTSGVGSVGGG